ncbi:MAG: hypothetical protein H7338_03145, partial [Candidatus Sericytochromatia bacterium]|nr:hypothetical protein [Candidatus Sericytochromatia bacterium]
MGYSDSIGSSAPPVTVDPPAKSPFKPTLATIPEGNESVEAESSQVVDRAPPPPPGDVAQVTQSFVFVGEVSAFSLTPPTTATKDEARAKIAMFQDKTPTAISLSGDAVIFTYGTEHTKVSMSDLNALRQSGEISDSSRAMEAVRVAKNITSMPGLTSSQARDITRTYVKLLQPSAQGKQGTSPREARNEAYTQVTAALRLGPDPLGQLKKDLTVFENVTSVKAAKLFSVQLQPEVRAQFQNLFQQRTQALASGDFCKAMDLQDSMAALAKKYELPALGVTVASLPDPKPDPAPLTPLTHKAPQVERDLESRSNNLRPGDLISFTNSAEGGLKVGISAGIKAPIGGKSAPTLVSASVEGGVRLQGHTKGAIAC